MSGVALTNEPKLIVGVIEVHEAVPITETCGQEVARSDLDRRRSTGTSLDPNFDKAIFESSRLVTSSGSSRVKCYGPVKRWGFFDVQLRLPALVDPQAQAYLI